MGVTRVTRIFAVASLAVACAGPTAMVPRTPSSGPRRPIAPASASATRLAPRLIEEPPLRTVRARWRTIASLMRAPPRGSAMTMLADGRVLVTGGIRYEATTRRTLFLADASLVDLADGMAQPAAPMHVARAHHTATRLADGRVLVAGGSDESIFETARPRSLPDAEIFDPRTGRWARAAPLHTSRSDHEALPLYDGRVLVCAGRHDTSDAFVSSCEAYDPAKGAWTERAGPARPRGYGTFTELRDRRWLMVGGNQWGTGAMRDVDVFDPVTDRWSTRAPLARERAHHFATRLRDGRVLVVGGAGYVGNNDTSAIYDPERDTWRDAAPPPDARLDALFARLSDGRVLFACGDVQPGATPVAPLVDAQGAYAYDAATDAWQPIAPPPLRLVPRALEGRDGSLVFFARSEPELLAFE